MFLFRFCLFFVLFRFVPFELGKQFIYECVAFPAVKKSTYSSSTSLASPTSGSKSSSEKKTKKKM